MMPLRPAAGADLSSGQMRMRGEFRPAKRFQLRRASGINPVARLKRSRSRFGYAARPKDPTLKAPSDLAPGLPVRRVDWGRLRRAATSNWLLLLGLLALIVPTLVWVATVSWSQEQGAHGPIVMATGLWLLWGEWREARDLARPGSPLLTSLLLAPALIVYVVAMVTGVIEIAGVAMYGAVLAVAYGLVGPAVLKALWFPLFYLLFMFPPPDQLIAVITQPLKALISQSAVGFLHALGYPVAQAGVVIFIAQYELLVAAACAGLNSLISLSAIGLFYVYVRHHSNWRYAAVLMLAIVPAALLANWIRVLILVLLTYHFGESTAQGFLHNFAGVVMFAFALGFIFLVDSLMAPWRDRYFGGRDASRRFQ
jgi:exosortase